MPDVNQINKDVLAIGGAAVPEKAASLKDLPPNDAVVRTHTAAPQVIEDIDQPGENRRIDEQRITPPPISAMAVESAASNAGVGTQKRMPDFALAVIKVAMAREAFGSQKLKTLAAQVREQLGDIDVLLDLSTELTSLPDQDSHYVSDKMRNLIGKLEVHKIQVWKGDGKLSKEKLSEMKAQIASQIDKLRTSLQTTISTEIQPEANNLQSIMNIVQQIVQSDARMKRKATEVPR